MRRVYQSVLLLYPATYRTLYQSEMADVFEQALGDRGAGGLFAYLVFLWHEFAGVFARPCYADWRICAANTALLTFPHAGVPSRPSPGQSYSAIAARALHLSIPADIGRQPPADSYTTGSDLAACIILISLLSAEISYGKHGDHRKRQREVSAVFLLLCAVSCQAQSR